MFWLWLYIAAMFFVALPVGYFTRNLASSVVFTVWSLGHVTYTLGFPEPVTQAGLYGMAFAYCLLLIFLHPERWSGRCIAVVMLFLPLCAICCQWTAKPGMDPWWTIYGLAWAQVFLLVRPLQLIAGIRRHLHWHRQRRPDRLMMVMA